MTDVKSKVCNRTCCYDPTSQVKIRVDEAANLQPGSLLITHSSRTPLSFLVDISRPLVGRRILGLTRLFRQRPRRRLRQGT